MNPAIHLAQPGPGNHCNQLRPPPTHHGDSAGALLPWARARRRAELSKTATSVTPHWPVPNEPQLPNGRY